MNTILFDKVLDAATVAAFGILKSRQTEIDLDVFAHVAKPIYLAAIDELLSAWEQASQAIVSDETLRHFVSAQAVELGRRVVSAYNMEMMWAD